MATSTLTVTVSDRDTGVFGNKLYVLGTFKFSASPDVYAIGGVVANFGPLTKSSRPPDWINVIGKAGYAYTYVPGVGANDGKLMVFQSAGSAAPLAELGAIAVPAGLSSDVIKFFAIFQGQV